MTVKVTIMGKEYLFTCKPEEEANVIKAAAYLDRNMRGIHDRGKLMGIEQCAIMAALNMSHKLLLQDNGADAVEHSRCRERVRELIDNIDGVLSERG